MISLCLWLNRPNFQVIYTTPFMILLCSSIALLNSDQFTLQRLFGFSLKHTVLFYASVYFAHAQLSVLNGFPPLSLCLNNSEITSRKPFLTFLRQDQSSQSALHISVLQYILLYINFFCFHVSLLWWNVRFLKDKQQAPLHLQQIMQCLTHLDAY